MYLSGDDCIYQLPFHGYIHLKAQSCKTVAFRVILTFQDHEDVCEFREIHCVHPKCGILVQRSDLANHLENSCSYREEMCRYCEKKIVFVDMKVNCLVIILFLTAFTVCRYRSLKRSGKYAVMVISWVWNVSCWTVLDQQSAVKYIKFAIHKLSLLAMQRPGTAACSWSLQSTKKDHWPQCPLKGLLFTFDFTHLLIQLQRT